MNEKSPLLTKITIPDDSIPRFIKDTTLKGKHRFKWSIPSQETESALKDRFFSIKICYIGMFLSAVSFTVTISSMWPFLQIIDITTDTSFFGWIVSAFSIGQLISSPIMGWWANKIRCHKIPIIFTLFITIFGNVIYIYLESIRDINDTKKIFSPKAWMLVSRFIMGVGAACAAVIRSYVSSATNLEERTSALANISACQGLGFIIGPVLQAALVPLGYPGSINSSYFHLNMYTSPALLSIIIYAVIVVIIFYKFNEYVVLEQDSQNINKVYGDDSINVNDADYESSLVESIRNLPPPDYLAIGLTLLLFFINCFIFSFFETLSSPLTIDMYAWSKKEATLYNGIILGGFGILAVIVVLFSKPLAKKFSEKLLMLVGYVILLISTISLLPWGDKYPSVQIPTIQPGHRNTTTSPFNVTTTTRLMTSTNEAPRGCPLDYDWCYYTPIVRFFQFILGFIFLVCGYSMTNVMSFAIYSKLLGPKPQGFMMGLLTSCGSLSRAVGPIVVSYLYGFYGPRVSFSALGSIVIIAILIICFTYKRYEAYKFA